MTMHFVKIKSTAIVVLGLLITFQQVAWSLGEQVDPSSANSNQQVNQWAPALQLDPRAGPRAPEKPRAAEGHHQLNLKEDTHKQQQVEDANQSHQHPDDLIKHNNVHRLMSKQDLRRTFQVDSHDQVPEYEILKLTVNDDGSHLISPISDLGELEQQQQHNSYHWPGQGRPADQQQQADTTNKSNSPSTTTSTTLTNSNNNNKSNNLIDNHSRHKRSSETQNDAGDDSAGAPQTQGPPLVAPTTGDKSTATATTATTTTTTRTLEAKLNNDNSELDKLIVMNLSTFGRDFKLRLKRNADFQQRIKDMKMFMAESTSDGQLRYTEIKQSLHNNNNNNNNNRHHPQEPHKRAVTASDQQQEAALAEEQEKKKKKKKNDKSFGKVSSGQDDDKPSSQQVDNNKQTTSGNTSSELSPSPSAAVVAETSASDKKPQQNHSNNNNNNNNYNLWNIGSTYHDEDNLAALLIEQDGKTGQLQVDGTIGNDFVIKPMPAATLEALALKRRQQLQQRQQQVDRAKRQRLAASTSTLASGGALDELTAAASQPADLERTSGGPAAGNRSALLPADGRALERLAGHLHDDDPHDDDEMFLDEDEALELAHLQASALVESTHTGNQSSRVGPGHPNRQLPHLRQSGSPPARPLSKTASERKWKKYRKLMAQTQVPKPHQQQQQVANQQATVNNQPAASAATSSSSSSSSSSAAPEAPEAPAAPAPEQPDKQRARRHAQPPQNDSRPRVVRVSHHIVYRQKPSSEASSSEHQHSFMLAPGQQSMEEMALRFLPTAGAHGHSVSKRSAHSDGHDTSYGPNSIDSTSGRLSAAANTQDQWLQSTGAEGADEADYAHDPMGGQFYLEPGSITGFERAGYPDWSLVNVGGSRRGALAGALPPYALNGTHLDARATLSNETAQLHLNSSSHRRFKRHLRQQQPLRARGSQVRRKRQAPDTVWPEVLLVVDYDSFLLHGGDSRDVKRYFVSFWNGVDLRYKLLVHPHIRISLAGMIVAKDRDATPYLERNRLRAPNADAVDAAGALTDMGKYLYREDRLPTYDLAVVITKLDMCRRRYEGGRCNRGTAGFAYVGGACVVNKRLEKVNSVAIIEDSGGFSGIIVAAHEVGHLLGCVHDGSPPPSYLGGPGATHCPWEEGFIMSDLRHTERGFRWSQCSVEQFKHFLNGETATCLYNYPHESQMLHRLLPGTMLSLDEQCKRDRGTNACFKDARVCAQLFCFDSASGYCVSYRPAAEGSPCGEGQHCRNGKCVGEMENIIPDYTHQSQTVVARRPLVAPPAGPVPPPPPPHPASLARLADNGLSASSTSTATSSPDSKGLQSASSSSSAALASSAATGATGATGATAPSSASGGSSRRMDTFLIDTPLYGGTGPTSTFGSRYATDVITSRSSSSALLSSSPSSSLPTTPAYNKRNQLNHQQPANSKLFNAPMDSGYHLHHHHHHQQQQQYLRPYSAAIYRSRSGQQAPPTYNQQQTTGIVHAKSSPNQKRYRQQ